MRLPEPGTIQIAPSILSADFARLVDEIGSNTLVAGNAIFGQTDRIAAIEALYRSTRSSEQKNQSTP
ncbi:hypothetical protein ACFL6U_10080 [Planctomycetota bacterium]